MPSFFCTSTAMPRRTWSRWMRCGWPSSSRVGVVQAREGVERAQDGPGDEVREADLAWPPSASRCLLRMRRFSSSVRTGMRAHRGRGRDAGGSPPCSRRCAARRRGWAGRCRRGGSSAPPSRVLPVSPGWAAALSPPRRCGRRWTLSPRVRWPAQPPPLERLERLLQAAVRRCRPTRRCRPPAGRWRCRSTRASSRPRRAGHARTPRTGRGRRNSCRRNPG